MSAGDDNVFARWSRLKRAARQDGLAEKAPGPAASDPEAGTRAEPVEAEPVDAEEVQAEPVEAEPANAEPVEAVPAEALPRLEDLHADSDLSAFLRKGVPAALKNTALRKMWSLDPVIRDYVGPAEYAWDFNTPGSMAGFGPLEANSAVVDFLSTVGRSVLSDKEEAPAATEVAAAQPIGPDNASPSDGLESVETEPTAEPAAPDAPPAAEPTSVQSDPPPAAADGEATSSETAESALEPVRRLHGGALPR